MRRLFAVATLSFWLAVAALWLAAWLSPAEEAPQAVASGEPRYTAAEVARHDRAEDCWMIIDGVVYDLTAYLPEHPSRPDVIEAWCGREASEAYRSKMRGRAHSPYADGLLPGYRIGVAAADAVSTR